MRCHAYLMDRAVVYIRPDGNEPIRGHAVVFDSEITNSNVCPDWRCAWPRVLNRD
jgi:hypothetical protein